MYVTTSHKKLCVQQKQYCNGTVDSHYLGGVCDHITLQRLTSPVLKVLGENIRIQMKLKLM